MAKPPTPIDRRSGGWDRGFRRILGGVAAVSLSIAAAVGLYAVVFQTNLWGTERVLMTVGMLGLSSALGLACEWARGARTSILHRAVMVIGLVASLAGWVLLLPSIWRWGSAYGTSTYELFERLARAAAVCYFCASAIAYDGVFHLMGFRGAAVWVRRVGCVGAYAVALTFSDALLADAQNDDALRIIIAGSIIAGTAFIIAPVLRALFPSMRLTPEDVLATDVIAPFTCPACATAQRIVLGRKVRCTSCDLGIDLRLDAPTCACGYNLAGLTTTTCPECGAEVPKRHTWALALAAQKNTGEPIGPPV